MSDQYDEKAREVCAQVRLEWFTNEELITAVAYALRSTAEAAERRAETAEEQLSVWRSVFADIAHGLRADIAEALGHDPLDTPAIRKEPSL